MGGHGCRIEVHKKNKRRGREVNAKARKGHRGAPLRLLRVLRVRFLATPTDTKRAIDINQTFSKSTLHFSPLSHLFLRGLVRDWVFENGQMFSIADDLDALTDAK